MRLATSYRGRRYHALMKLQTRGFLFLAALCLAAPTLAQEEVLTPERVAELRSVVAVEISPDAAHVAYLWLIPADPFAEDDGRSRAELPA